MPTSAELKSGLNMVLVVSETVREAGEIPSGTLYAALLGSVSLEGYNKIIGIIKDAGLVTEKNNLLKWIGPFGQERR